MSNPPHLGAATPVAAPSFPADLRISMPSSLPIVSQARLEVLVGDYQRVVMRRRRQSFLVLAILAVLVLLAGRIGEVDLNNLVSNISNFTSYFGRITPKLSIAHFFADVADWYWNITGWLKLLF